MKFSYPSFLLALMTATTATTTASSSLLASNMMTPTINDKRHLVPVDCDVDEFPIYVRLALDCPLDELVWTISSASTTLVSGSTSTSIAGLTEHVEVGCLDATVADAEYTVAFSTDVALQDCLVEATVLVGESADDDRRLHVTRHRRAKSDKKSSSPKSGSKKSSSKKNSSSSNNDSSLAGATLTGSDFTDAGGTQGASANITVVEGAITAATLTDANGDAIDLLATEAVTSSPTASPKSASSSSSSSKSTKSSKSRRRVRRHY